MRRAKRLKKIKVSRNFGYFIKIIFPLLLVLLGFGFFKFNNRFWNGKDKVSVSVQEANGDVSVKVYDPNLQEVTTLVIPGDTQVAVSGNLGTLRIKNVWQLGVNEKKEGTLLAQTVTKNFLFPVFLWRGVKGETNIPVGDRIRLWYFEKTAKNLQKSEINLGESQFVKKQKLNDGEMGYKVIGGISERLTVYFLDNDFSLNSPKVYIKDKTGTYGVAENVGKVIEVMGGKVVTIEKGESEDQDCTVSGKLAKKVSRIFDCAIEKKENDFDLEITLGEFFAKRF